MGGWSSLCPSHATHGKETHNHCKGAWVGLRASVELINFLMTTYCLFFTEDLIPVVQSPSLFLSLCLSLSLWNVNHFIKKPLFFIRKFIWAKVSGMKSNVLPPEYTNCLTYVIQEWQILIPIVLWGWVCGVLIQANSVRSLQDKIICMHCFLWWLKSSGIWQCVIGLAVPLKFHDCGALKIMGTTHPVTQHHISEDF